MAILIGNIALTPPVFLAPLAGITDLPFRNLVSSFGAGLVVSEMVASHEMVQARPGSTTQSKVRAEFGGNNTAVQIAGRDAYWMAECARMVADNGTQLIDINMGCPAKKVTSGYSGSALLKDLDHALTLIEAVVNAVDVPVTLKTRLGWDDDLLNAPELARRAVDAGVQMITIHGRTRCQFYKGKADWAAIAQVKDVVTVPVIANGDIIDSTTAKLALKQSGADGVMVGRGAQGRPWQLAQIAAEVYGTDKPSIPQGNEFISMISSHYEEMLDFYGPTLGNRVARKHLGWYMDGMAVSRDLRRTIMTEKNTDTVLRLLRQLPTEKIAA